MPIVKFYNSPPQNPNIRSISHQIIFSTFLNSFAIFGHILSNLEYYITREQIKILLRFIIERSYIMCQSRCNRNTWQCTCREVIGNGCCGGGNHGCGCGCGGNNGRPSCGCRRREFFECEEERDDFGREEFEREEGCRPPMRPHCPCHRPPVPPCPPCPPHPPIPPHPPCPPCDGRPFPWNGETIDMTEAAQQLLHNIEAVPIDIGGTIFIKIGNRYFKLCFEFESLEKQPRFDFED